MIHDPRCLLGWSVSDTLEEGLDMVTDPPPPPTPTYPSCLVNRHGVYNTRGNLCSCFFLVHCLFFLLLVFFTVDGYKVVLVQDHPPSSSFRSRLLPSPISQHSPPPLPLSLSLPPVNSKTPMTDLRYTDNLNHWVEPYIM